MAKEWICPQCQHPNWHSGPRDYCRSCQSLVFIGKRVSLQPKRDSRVLGPKVLGPIEAFNDADEAFANLWSHLYPEGPKSWESNPAVFVYEFELHKEAADAE